MSLEKKIGIFLLTISFICGVMMIKQMIDIRDYSSDLSELLINYKDYAKAFYNIFAYGAFGGILGFFGIRIFKA